MKKALLSLGALVLSGVILSSCSFGGGAPKIKAPKKGKAVDSVSTTLFGDTSFEIKKDDDYKDVAEKLYDLYNNMPMAWNGYTSAFESCYEEIDKYKETNRIQNERQVQDKVSVNETTTYYSDTSGDYKHVDNVFEAEVYSNNRRIAKQNSTYDKATEKNNANYSEMYYGYAKVDSSTNDYSFKEAIIQKGNMTETGKYSYQEGTEANEGRMAFYLEGSGKTSDEDFYTEYYYKLPNMYTESYRKPDKLDVEPEYSESIYMGTFEYDESFKDMIDYSFELTDSEIILKAKVNYTGDAYDFAYGKCEEKGDVNDSTVHNYLKDNVMQNEYKGSYIEYEIWIKYDQKDEDPENTFNYLSYTYYKETTYNKFDISEELTKARVADYLDEKIQNDYIGKKYTKKGMSSEVKTYKYNDPEKTAKQYKKKTEKLVKEAKKYNLFDKLTVYEA